MMKKLILIVTLGLLLKHSSKMSHALDVTRENVESYLFIIFFEDILIPNCYVYFDQSSEENHYILPNELNQALNRDSAYEENLMDFDRLISSARDFSQHISEVVVRHHHIYFYLL